MTVDATKIKVGQKIRLRNGDVKTVTKVVPTYVSTFPVNVFWEGGDYAYTRDGLYWDDDEDDRDIVEIIPKETSEEELSKDEMTLRDQFAMAAMSGILTKDKKYPLYKDLARWSYEIADEMMKARKENN